MAATDEIIILVANVEISDSASNIELRISGTNGSGGGGGGTSTFNMTTFSLSGEPTWTPAHISLPPDLASIGILFAAISVTTDISTQYQYQNMQLQMNTANITGPGTYTFGTNVTTGSSTLYYSPGTIRAASGSQVFTSTGGTLQLTTFGTSIGDHITGTFTANMANDDTPPLTGQIDATFDMIVGSIGAL
ncbi:MAG: hypothetical protein ABIE74_10225 [Pseudomonadota bacterium]